MYFQAKSLEEIEELLQAKENSSVPEVTALKQQ
jgi:hypothetical protein